MRFKLIVTVEYDADPIHYGTDDPQKMCEIDLENFKNSPEHLIEFIDTENAKMEITCVQRKVKKK